MKIGSLFTRSRDWLSLSSLLAARGGAHAVQLRDLLKSTCLAELAGSSMTPPGDVTILRGFARCRTDVRLQVGPDDYSGLVVLVTP